MKKLIIVLLQFFIFSFIKAEDSIFEIKDNEVFLDNSGDILELRNKSKQIAFKNAFTILTEKILSSEDNQKIYGKIGANLESLVADFKFQKEKISDVNYFAVIDVNFDSKKVKSLFSEINLQANIFVSETFLVIPIMKKFKTFYLWEKDNYWYDFLKNEYEEQGLLKLYFPEKNHKNKLLISANKLLDKNFEEIDRFLKEHKKRKAIIAFVNESYNYEKKIFETEIKSFVYQNNQFINVNILADKSLKKKSKKSQIDLLAKIYIKDLQFWWKNQIDRSKNNSNKGINFIVFELENTKRSIELEGLLFKILGEKNMILKEFSKNRIVYSINTDYSIDQINLALEANNVRLEKNSSKQDFFNVIDEK